MPAGAPIGNVNARGAKIWQQALKRALARKLENSVDAGLDALADKVVELAMKGEQWATLEIANRMDGKPAQSMEVSGPDGGPIEMIDGGNIERARRLVFILHQARRLMVANGNPLLEQARPDHPAT